MGVVSVGAWARPAAHLRAVCTSAPKPSVNPTWYHCESRATGKRLKSSAIRTSPPSRLSPVSSFCQRPGGRSRVVSPHSAARRQAEHQTRHDRHRALAAPEGDDVRGALASRCQRRVGAAAAAAEQVRSPPAQVERLSRISQSLGSPSSRRSQIASGDRPSNSASRRRRRSIVHRPAVVGVHQGQVPELAALVDVRHARRGELDQRLGQRVDPARRRSVA